MWWGCGYSGLPRYKCLYNDKGVLAPSGGRLCGGDAVIAALVIPRYRPENLPLLHANESLPLSTPLHAGGRCRASSE